MSEDSETLGAGHPGRGLGSRSGPASAAGCVMKVVRVAGGGGSVRSFTGAALLLPYKALDGYDRFAMGAEARAC